MTSTAELGLHEWRRLKMDDSVTEEITCWEGYFCCVCSPFCTSSLLFSLIHYNSTSFLPFMNHFSLPLSVLHFLHRCVPDSVLTRAHFKACTWLHVLAPGRAHQGQPFHSSWVIRWAHFRFAAQRDYCTTSIWMFIHKTTSEHCWLTTEWSWKCACESDKSITASLCPSFSELLRG